MENNNIFANNLTCIRCGLPLILAKKIIWNKEHLCPKSRTPYYIYNNPDNIVLYPAIINSIKGNLFPCEWNALKNTIKYKAINLYNLKQIEKDVIIYSIGEIDMIDCKDCCAANSEFCQEKWLNIPWLPYYQVSNLGRIKVLQRNIKTKKWGKSTTESRKEQIISTDSNTHNYESFMAYGKRYYVHRVVLCVFNGYDYNYKLDTNHKDFNTKNNNLLNLEFLTRQENLKYSVKNNRNKGTYHEIPIMCVETQKVFNSAKEAMKQMFPKANHNHIYESVYSNGIRSVFGFHFIPCGVYKSLQALKER